MVCHYLLWRTGLTLTLQLYIKCSDKHVLELAVANNINLFIKKLKLTCNCKHSRSKVNEALVDLGGPCAFTQSVPVRIRPLLQHVEFDLQPNNTLRGAWDHVQSNLGSARLAAPPGHCSIALVICSANQAQRHDWTPGTASQPPTALQVIAKLITVYCLSIQLLLGFHTSG